MRLRNGMHIRVTEHGSNSEFDGRLGRVVRLSTKGDFAWVDADEPLPANLRVFDSTDPRANHFKIYADECVEM
jgi:hypothetical protein